MPLMSSTELIQKLNEHRDNIGKSKATYQEGFLYGYGLLAKEYSLLLDIISDFESRVCESCKYQEVEQHDIDHFHKWCFIHCTSKINEEMEDFSCNRWEKKQ